MPNVRSLQRSFSGGEITPEMFGRIDDAKYQSGLALCRNFVVKPHGPAENRAGFAFVREVRDSTKKTRLLPFTFSTTQTMIVEMGAGYFRFHTQGATLMDGAAPYEITNPYAEADLFDVHHVQSADVLTLVHPGYAPRELRRLGPSSWALTAIDFNPPVSPPAAPTVTATGHTSVEYTYHYVVTSVGADGVQESAASLPGSAGGNLFETGAVVTVSWAPVAGATRYRVYKRQGGLYGYIGQTDGASIVDDNIAPDLGVTPPRYDVVFQTNGIVSVPVANGGSGYGTVLSGGQITAVYIVNGGTEYNTPTLTVSDPTGSGASFSVTVNTSGVITGVTVLTQGSGYTSPTFVISDEPLSTEGGTDPAGSGAQFTANVTPVENTPTLGVTDSTGTGAVLAPVVVGGVITAVKVVNPGQNYTNPSISVTYAAGGSGATFGAAVLSGVDYPGAVSYFEQRRAFAGTQFRPQNIWLTKSGTEANMSYSLPTQASDRIAFRVAAREANTVRHIVPLAQLLLLTSSAEWRVTSINSDAITPDTFSVQPQSYVGASNVQPVIINNTMLYGAARGGHVREMAYSGETRGFTSGDVSLRATHLFDNLEVTDMAFGKSPMPVVWCVSSSGKLLGLTYVPEQQIGAWHQHDTAGVFESCAVVAEGKEDVLYCVIRRTIGGESVRYIERMASRQFVTPADAFFVDAGSTYDGTPVSSVSGLDHLEGETVSILVDGAVHPQRVVTGGVVPLDIAASKVHVGLPITADLQTLPAALALNDGSFGQGRFKNVNKVWLRVHRSSGVFVGPSAERLTEAKQRTTEPYGSPPALKSEEIEVTIAPSWGDSGQVFVRQVDPLPLTVASMVLEVAVGG